MKQGYSIGRLLNDARRILKNSRGSATNYDAIVLLADAIKKDKEYLFTYPDDIVPADISKKYLENVRLRSYGIPVAYITGHKEFMGLDFYVDRSVLIPRPDTETLVEAVLCHIKSSKAETLLEIGTGSGCIAVSIAKYSGIRVTATDISRRAVKTAQKNAAANGVSVDVFASNLFNSIPENEYDIIVSNPPYITAEELETLSPEVCEFEPRKALYGGAGGLRFYNRISLVGKNYLKSGGRVFFEIGASQAKSVKEILLREGYHDIKCLKDLAMLDRVIHAEKP